MNDSLKLRDLVTDSGTGMLSHTKLWANIAYCAATIAFGYMVYMNTATAEIWLIYLASIGASATLSKLLSLRYGVSANTDLSAVPNTEQAGVKP